MGLLQKIEVENFSTHNAQTPYSSPINFAGASNSQVGVSPNSTMSVLTAVNFDSLTNLSHLTVASRVFNDGETGKFNLFIDGVKIGDTINVTDSFLEYVIPVGIIAGTKNLELVCDATSDAVVFDYVSFYDTPQPNPPTISGNGTVGTPYPGTANESGTIEIFTEAGHLVHSTVTTGSAAPYSWSWASPVAGTYKATLGVANKPISAFSSLFTINPLVIPTTDLEVTVLGVTAQNKRTIRVKNVGSEVIPIGKVVALQNVIATAVSPQTVYVKSSVATTNGTAVLSSDNIQITLSSSVGNNQYFDVEITFSTFIKKATNLVIGGVAISPNFTETNTANNAPTQNWKPTIDIAFVSVVSSLMNKAVVRFKNIGIDALQVGEILSMTNTGVPVGSTYAVLSSKGSIAGSNLTIDDEIVTDETFDIEITYPSNLITSATMTLSLSNANIIDVSTNNIATWYYTVSSGGGYTYAANIPLTASTAKEDVIKPKSSNLVLFVGLALISLPFLVWGFVKLLTFNSNNDGKRD